MSANDKPATCCVCSRKVWTGDGRIIGRPHEGDWVVAHESCLDASYGEAEAKREEPPKAEGDLAMLKEHANSLRNMLKAVNQRIAGIEAKQHRANTGSYDNGKRSTFNDYVRGDWGERPFDDSFFFGSGARAGGRSSQGAASATAASGCFEVLGLKPGANKEQILNRFRDMAKKCHPDKGGNTAEFVRITKAKDEALRSCGAK